MTKDQVYSHSVLDTESNSKVLRATIEVASTHFAEQHWLDS